MEMGFFALLTWKITPFSVGFVSSLVGLKTDEICFLKPLIRSQTCTECAGSTGPLEKQ